MFFDGSRYQYVGEYIAKDIGGKSFKIKKVRKIERPAKAFPYIIKDGDRLDLLANRFYGDPTKFWLICDANEPMFPGDLLVTGKRIIIPREGL